MNRRQLAELVFNRLWEEDELPGLEYQQLYHWLVTEHPRIPTSELKEVLELLRQEYAIFVESAEAGLFWYQLHKLLKPAVKIMKIMIAAEVPAPEYRPTEELDVWLFPSPGDYYVRVVGTGQDAGVKVKWHCEDEKRWYIAVFDHRLICHMFYSYKSGL